MGWRGREGEEAEGPDEVEKEEEDCGVVGDRWKWVVEVRCRRRAW